MKRQVLPGDVFGRYTIIQEAQSRISGKRIKRYMQAKCKCGTIKEVCLSSLVSGHIVSCGCYNREISSAQKCRTTHGMAYSRLYRIWKGMRRRCYSSNEPAYARYGGRGIFVCQEWNKSFLPFYEWAIQNGYSDNLSLDRINTNGNYEPSNCRWATDEIQANNKRSTIKYEFEGKYLSLPQISRIIDIGFPTLYRRINENKLTIEEAISIPLNGRCKKDLNVRKFTIEQIKEIYLSTEKQADVVKKYGISKAHFWRIKAKKVYSEYLNTITA